LKDSARCTIDFQKALIRYLNKDFASSLHDIWNAQACGSDTRETRILFLMILLENERWEDFSKAFTKAAASNSEIDTSTFLREFRDPILYDVDKFRRYSKVPGRGLFKLGMPKKGFTNIALQVVFVGFAVSEIYSGFYSTAFFSGFQPARRFYNGGRTLTESLVDTQNAKLISEHKQKGYQYINGLYPQ
jgi:hypothetical protein